MPEKGMMPNQFKRQFKGQFKGATLALFAVSSILAASVALAENPSATAPSASPAAAPAPVAPAPVANPATNDAKPSDSPPEVELTAEEKAERDGRKACKADICRAFRAPQSSGNDVACPVVKSWRKEQLTKLVAKLKVTWPYEGVRCTSAVSLKRADLIKAMSADKLEVQLDKHAVSCTVNRAKDGPSEIKFDFAPKVTFEKGKATKAKLNWGKIEAPTLIKSALWTATAADNTVNLLSGTLVEDINDFIGKKCDEVKDEWSK